MGKFAWFAVGVIAGVYAGASVALKTSKSLADAAFTASDAAKTAEESVDSSAAETKPE